MDGDILYLDCLFAKRTKTVGPQHIKKVLPVHSEKHDIAFHPKYNNLEIYCDIYFWTYIAQP